MKLLDSLFGARAMRRICHHTNVFGIYKAVNAEENTLFCLFAILNELLKAMLSPVFQLETS